MSQVKTVEQLKANREMNIIEQRLSSPTVTLLLGASILGAIIYLFFLLQPSFRGDLLPYIMAITAEFFLISQGILSFWTILSGRSNPRHYEYHDSQNKLFGSKIGKTLSKNLSSTRLKILEIYKST